MRHLNTQLTDFVMDLERELAARGIDLAADPALHEIVCQTADAAYRSDPHEVRRLTALLDQCLQERKHASLGLSLE